MVWNELIRKVAPGRSPQKVLEFNPKTRFFPTIQYSTHPFYRELTPNFESSLPKAFMKIFGSLVSEELQLAKCRPQKKQFSPNSIGDALFERGIYSFDPTSKDHKQIVEHSLDAFQRIEKKRETLRSDQCGVEAVSSQICHYTEGGPSFEYFSKWLERTNVLGALFDLMGTAYALKFAAAQWNQAGDTGIQRFCRFEDGTISPSYYAHIDSTAAAFKIIYYLNDEVTESNGAFRYVVGSHRELSPVARSIRKTNDRLGLEQLNLVQRCRFMALPEVFQQKANFGNDLLEPDAQDFLQHEIAVESRAGKSVLFDSNGIHRGAIFTEKDATRKIIQMLIVPKSTLKIINAH